MLQEKTCLSKRRQFSKKPLVTYYQGIFTLSRPALSSDGSEAESTGLCRCAIWLVLKGSDRPQGDPFAGPHHREEPSQDQIAISP